jgi:AraC family transcriptional regulator, regulatory protein of adaptative response / methylated-DNA-[protein]-cysteine methyltransferase
MNTTTAVPGQRSHTTAEQDLPLSTTGPVVGVKTTKIYCRTICRPSVRPKPENCVPFPSAEAARAAGYRACKLCRPDDESPPLRKESRTMRRPALIRYAVDFTPLGYAFVGLTERGLCCLYLLDDTNPTPGLARMRADFPGAELVEDRAALGPMLERVRAHLTDGHACDDLPLDLHGTPFQKKVWEALRTIPRGTTRTYGAVAQQLGLPVSAARAVGTACGANPVSVLVPCHRVLRSNGELGGFRWGLERKRALLDQECPQGSLAL